MKYSFTGIASTGYESERSAPAPSEAEITHMLGAMVEKVEMTFGGLVTCEVDGTTATFSSSEEKAAGLIEHFLKEFCFSRRLQFELLAESEE